MTTKELNKVSKQYIVDCIDSEPYDVKTETDKEKLQFLFDTFKAEKGWEIERIGQHKAFESWCMGLPTVFNIVFNNYDILELAKFWGSIPLDATERQAEKILDNYWNFITVKTFQLFRKHNIQ